jgi:SAM-dependent methyltransferase
MVEVRTNLACYNTIMNENDAFKKAVKEAYEVNNYAQEYRERELLDFEKMFFDETISRLSSNATILDLGCGSGYPYDAYFSNAGFDLTGVDFSSKQIEIAKQKNPNGTYITGDITSFEPENKVSLVLALFSILHVPRNEHATLFEKIYNYLENDGLFLLTLSNKEPAEVIEREFTGHTMLWSYFDSDSYLEMLEKAGFTVQYMQNQRDYGLDPQDWILLKK